MSVQSTWYMNMFHQIWQIKFPDIWIVHDLDPDIGASLEFLFCKADICYNQISTPFPFLFSQFDETNIPLLWRVKLFLNKTNEFTETIKQLCIPGHESRFSSYLVYFHQPVINCLKCVFIFFCRKEQTWFQITGLRLGISYKRLLSCYYGKCVSAYSKTHTQWCQCLLVPTCKAHFTSLINGVNWTLIFSRL